MIVFNTTYAVHESVDAQWLDYVRNELIARMLLDGFTAPRLMVIDHQVERGYRNYALQFEHPGDEAFSDWQSVAKSRYDASLRRAFGEKVLSFSTMMTPLDLSTQK